MSQELTNLKNKLKDEFDAVMNAAMATEPPVIPKSKLKSEPEFMIAI